MNNTETTTTQNPKGISSLLGHTLALITAFVWGITFVSTKLLLESYSPLAIMVMRFTLAYIGLWIIHPHFYRPKSLRSEMNYFLAGLTGVTGYFFLENTALIYTTVSNTGLILASAPLFVALVAHFFTHDERFHTNLLTGFFVAVAGVALVIFNGQAYLKVNPLGDFLAVLAALIWAFYSLAIKRMDHNLSAIFLTRRTFFYGILLGLAWLLATEGGLNLSYLSTKGNSYHLLFLGLIASGMCYVFWSLAIRAIGAIKTSNYIYLMPLFTMVASWLVLKESITPLMLVGGGCILLGVYITERGWPFTTSNGSESAARRP